MPSTRTVDVHVAWLRQKIEDNPRHPQLHPHGARPGLQVRRTERTASCTAPRLQVLRAPLWRARATDWSEDSADWRLRSPRNTGDFGDSRLAGTALAQLTASEGASSHGDQQGHSGVGGGRLASWPGRPGHSWRPTIGTHRRRPHEPAVARRRTPSTSLRRRASRDGGRPPPSPEHPQPVAPRSRRAPARGRQPRAAGPVPHRSRLRAVAGVPPGRRDSAPQISARSRRRPSRVAERAARRGRGRRTAARSRIW